VKVLALAHAYEQATDWHSRRPDRHIRKAAAW
jgi:hypothetical protein